MDNAEATKKLIGDPAAKYTTVTDLTDAGWIQYTGTVTEIAAIETKLRGYLDLTLLDGLGVNLVNNVLVDWRWIVGADGVLTADLRLMDIPFIQEFEALSPNAPTGVAMSQNWYNVEGGLIIVNSAWSPKYMYGQSSGQSWWPSTVTEKTVEELTVSKSSDVMYIEWASQAEDVTTLQYVIQLDVVNLGSRSVMNTVMQDNDWSTPTFFYQGSTEFDALLGTPNGNPQAWILINHKAELGVKTVYSIMIWTSSTVMEGAPNVYLDTDEGGNAASLRNMCYVYYDEQEEEEYSDSEIEDSDSEDEQPLGFWGLCQHMLFTFEDVSTSEEDAMDLV
ncbi:uncharacterized protein N7483_013170 [Penicillium malachiteum]|uniref:uncharacterized protein n=1 Tax=Penicillium malachiteum TaxID=1324776 RepID=UPI002547D0C7|nr:uncharacterized protein N7483_013170 [Penicillium malachiteum]KAJ5715989.1 hypothetical protein N7483_013170 [Penicillium malachiteum]